MSTVITLTDRSRRDLQEEVQHIRLWAWQLEENLKMVAIDADEAIQQLHAIAEMAKKVDRKVKARRRDYQRKTATPGVSKAVQDQIERVRRQVAEQRKWIEQCGGNLSGYILRYGAADDPDKHGDGGPAIFAADNGKLQQLLSELEALTGSRS